MLKIRLIGCKGRTSKHLNQSNTFSLMPITVRRRSILCELFTAPRQFHHAQTRTWSAPPKRLKKGLDRERYSTAASILAVCVNPSQLVIVCSFVSKNVLQNFQPWTTLRVQPEHESFQGDSNKRTANLTVLNFKNKIRSLFDLGCFLYFLFVRC